MQLCSELLKNVYDLMAGILTIFAWCQKTLPTNRLSKLLTMKILWIILFTVYLVSCSNTGEKKIAAKTFDENSVIYEGKGVDDVVLDSINEASLKKLLPTGFELIEHNNYSGEIFYKEQGVSFYYLLKDSTRSIFAMAFNPTFKGKTTKGFVISQMTVSDMIKLYGHPRWQHLDDSTLYAWYDNDGIYFNIAPRKEAKTSVDNIPWDDREEESVADSIFNKRLGHFYDSAYARDKIAELSIESSLKK